MKNEIESNVPHKYMKVTPSVLDAFDLLKAPKEDAKLTGGARIISQLRGSESDKDTEYALKRLVRSLGANVPEIRTGYFATLVALLIKFDQISVSKLLELAKKELHANGSSKSEVGDVALGLILVTGAVFRSGLMLRCSDVEQKEVLQILIAASKKKSYLSTVAYLILLDFANGLDQDQFASIIWSNIKQEFKKELKEHTLDSLYFLLIVSTKYPGKVKLRKLIGIPEILCEDTIHVICEKLMAGVDYDSLNHPIYKEIGTCIANSPHLQLFWASGIDSQLAKHNRNRELVALNILTTILNNLKENVEVIPELLSRNFFKLFMDWFKGLQTASKIRNKRDNEDDSKIMVKRQKELLNALAKALKHEKVDNKIRVKTLKKLLFNPGEMNFTEITGTTIVKSIISDLDKDGVHKMAKLMKGVILNTTKKLIKEDVERNWYNNEKAKAAELISYLVIHEAVKDDTEFKLIYMKLLMCFGFFKLKDDVSVSSELSGAMKSCFYRCFTSRFSNVDNLVSVLSSLSSFICTKFEQNDEIRNKIEKHFPKENMDCWKMLTDICQNIQKNESKSKVDNVFLILLYQLGLFLFSEPTHVKMAKSSIKELISCYEHYRKDKKKKRQKIKEGVLTEDPEWIEVLVEVLLSILSTESSVLRSIVQCVFRLLWEYLTPSSIGQIVSVLDPDTESNPLNRDSDSEEDESDGEMKESEDDNEENGEENEESDSNIEDDDDGEDMKTPDQLRMAVQKALGAAPLDSDMESVDADLIDEEEGKKLDEALAEAFKQFHQGKVQKKSKKQRKDKKVLSDFRIRVLDLIDIYLEKDPSMDICLGMIAPLMRCLEFCIQDNDLNELGNRVRKTIKILTKIRKFSSTEDVTIGILCDYLKSIIDKGTRSHFMFQALGDVITHFATFVIHCSQKLNSKYPKLPKQDVLPLLEIFKEAFQSYFHNRNCFLPIIFFHEVLQTEWEGNYELMPIVIENIFNNNIRQFRRNEAVELMAGFYRALKRSKPSSDQVLAKLSNLEKEFENILNKTLKGEGFDAKKSFSVALKKMINTMKNFHETCHIDANTDFGTLIHSVESIKCTANVKSKNFQVHQVENVQNGKTKSKRKIKKKRKLEQTSNGGIQPQQKRAKKSSQSE